MRFLTKMLVHWVRWMAMLAVAVVLTGCESGSDHIGDGFDFWINDPNIYVAMGDSITAGYGLSS